MCRKETGKMWDRKELKAKGKAAYNANKLACIFAALILMIAGGVGSGYATASSVASRNYVNSDQTIGSYSEDSPVIYDEDGDDVTIELNGEDINGITNGIVPVIVFSTVIIVIVLIGVAIGLAITAFLLNPMNVGSRKFFIQNASDPETSLGSRNFSVAFGDHYKSIVKSMFGTQMINLLWMLLLIVPGIYKAYCWRLVPFIVADDPEITGREARAMSAQMMNGSKWASFVLDLSFIGWRLVGALTFGILNIVFTNPYEAATDAELYLALRGAAEE